MVKHPSPPPSPPRPFPATSPRLLVFRVNGARRQLHALKHPRRHMSRRAGRNATLISAASCVAIARKNSRTFVVCITRVCRFAISRAIRRRELIFALARHLAFREYDLSSLTRFGPLCPLSPPVQRGNCGWRLTVAREYRKVENALPVDGHPSNFRRRKICFEFVSLYTAETIYSIARARVSCICVYIYKIHRIARRITRLKNIRSDFFPLALPNREDNFLTHFYAAARARALSAVVRRRNGIMPRASPRFPAVLIKCLIF